MEYLSVIEGVKLTLKYYPSIILWKSNMKNAAGRYMCPFSCQQFSVPHLTNSFRFHASVVNLNVLWLMFLFIFIIQQFLIFIIASWGINVKISIQPLRSTRGLLSVLGYLSCDCSLTLLEERKLRVFKNMVLRRIFGHMRDEVTGEWRRLHNEELNDLYS